MFKIGFLTLIIAALSNTACEGFHSSKKPSGGSSLTSPLDRKPFGTCDRKGVTTINLCMEAVGADYNEPGYLDILKSSCESSGGVFSTAVCEVTESFGVCIVAAGQPNATYVSYYPPQYTAASAQAECEASEGGVYFARAN